MTTEKAANLISARIDERTRAALLLMLARVDADEG